MNLLGRIVGLGGFVVALQCWDATYARADYVHDCGVHTGPTGISLAMNDTGGPTKRRIRAKMVISGLCTFGTPGFPSPPIADAHLQIYNAAGGPDAVCYQLPVEGWDLRGRYLDRTLFASPVYQAKFSTLSAVLRGTNPAQPLDYTLDEPNQTRVAVLLDYPYASTCGPPDFTVCNDGDALCPGSCQPTIARYCNEFIDARRDGPGRFLARRSQLCSTPPPACP